MNQYTQDFHAAAFPGYRPRQAWQWDPDAFWYRDDVPWVKLPMVFDTKHSAEFLRLNHDRLFSEIAEQQNQRQHNQNTDRAWFTVEHQHGWQQCAISRDTYPALATQVPATEMPAQTVQPVLHPDACQDVIKQISVLGIKLHWADVKALGPGGWIQPHRDPKVTGTTTMEYFWLPLNACSANLKMWPVGYLEPRCGHMYLVNNQTWLHSVINRDAWIRYVLVGRIDRHSLHPDLITLIGDSTRQQWFTDK